MRLRAGTILRAASGLLVILVVAGGCSRNERTTSDSSSTGAPHAAGARSTLPAPSDTAGSRPSPAQWREIMAQRESLSTHLEAREWTDVKSRASHLRDLVALYAGGFDRTTPMVAAQMDALVQAVDAATQDLTEQCDRQDLAGARRQRDRLQSILAQIGALAKEA